MVHLKGLRQMSTERWWYDYYCKRKNGRIDMKKIYLRNFLLTVPANVTCTASRLLLVAIVHSLTTRWNYKSVSRAKDCATIKETKFLANRIENRRILEKFAISIKPTACHFYITIFFFNIYTNSVKTTNFGQSLASFSDITSTWNLHKQHFIPSLFCKAASYIM
jgi:hypothetical protein